MQSQEIHLRDYYRILKKRRYVVYTFCSITIALVVLFTFTATPLYMADTRLLIEKAEQYTISEFGFTAHDPEFYATQYKLIKSRPVAKKVYEALKGDALFREYFEKIGEPKGLKGKVKGILMLFRGDDAGINELDPESEKRNLTIEAILENITVRPEFDTKLVTVSYYSRDPELARLVVNEVANAYIEALFELRMDSSHRALQWMSRKVDEERKNLDDSDTGLQRYMRENDIVTLEDRLAIVPQKLTELSTQLTRSETRREELETLYSKIRSLRALGKDLDSLPAIAADKTVSSLREQILKGDQKTIELSKKYGRKHPVMIESIEDLAQLKKKKAQEIGRVVESIKNEYDLSVSNEQNLRRQLSETKLEAHAINEKFVHYNALKREVETNRQLFESLLKKMREESIEEEGQTVNVMLVEMARTPKKPEKPRKALNLLAGLFMGMFGGVLLAFFFEYFDNTVKAAEDAEEKLGIPVLGMVSFLKREQKEDERHIERIVLEEPKSTFTENYKALRTAIMLSSADSAPKSILVTSMLPAEGKTSTAVNLALVIAQSVNKVLLVDTDLRKPRIHNIFGISNKSGLSTYLVGSNAKIIKEGPSPNLNIVPSGPIPPNPSELLGSEKFARFISSMQERYDVIIFDSPPVLTVTDSLVLSKHMDGTIVVARAAKTSYEAVRKGLRQISDVGSNVLGLLINAIDARKGGYYYDYYYYHKYDYYYSAGEDEDKEQE
ncbi:MAG: polysaccharide biosynthesis tyrosine autokinase [Thermodesulfovibrionales bacterium]|nr:polysaccharide biosynthesis tyrosine autokinase [Thermodesulfovibrionales bacterium]